MSNDNFTEVTNESWMSRLGNAFKGIVTGILLVVAATILLYWNEGRTVKRAGAIKDAQSAAVMMDNIETIDAQYNGKLVHATGMAKTDDILTDEEIGLSNKGIGLSREVEIYQWVEDESTKTEKNVGGSTTTTKTYSYSKEWTSGAVDSSRFKRQDGHHNTVSYPVKSQEWNAKNVAFGAYNFQDFMIKGIRVNDPLSLNELPDADKLKMKLKIKTKVIAQNPSWATLTSDLVHIDQNKIYVGTNEASPQIGDVKITYFYTPDTDVSVIAKVKGNTFEKYTTKKGESYHNIKVGTHSAESMFQSDKEQNNFMAWALRFLGIFLVCTGLNMILAPIVILADVLPILGDLAGVGTRLVTGLIGTAWSFIVIAFAWLAFRPVLGIIMLIAAIALIVFLGKKTKEAKAAQA